jgi:hypothetical protein
LSRAVKIILFLIFFAVFFEAGLFVSYTIVTQQAPNPSDLIEMQINGVSSLFNLGTPKLVTQKNIVILNEDEVVAALKAKTGVDGINLQTLTAQTYQSTSDSSININITAMGYKDSQTGGKTTNSSGPIVIKSNETYSITATATAVPKTGGVQVDVNTIVITSTRILYNK